MNIVFVGTGFVADYYMTTLKNYPNLKLKGVWDRDEARLKQFCAFYDVSAYESLDDILDNSEADIVINLTTPEHHFEINHAALSAGKHVYCEKPLAMDFEGAKKLGELADQKNLILCSAPANALGDAFGAASKLLNEKRIGDARLVYVQMEDGPVFRANWQDWKSVSGAAWPGVHEFEIGCTLEHAGYGISWLLGLFGPVRHLSAFSALTFADKGPGTEKASLGPDFSVGSLTFDKGVVAKITCGLSAPRNRSMTVLGDKGTMTIRDLWDNDSDILVAVDGERSITQKVLDRMEAKLGKVLPFNSGRGSKIKYARNKQLSLPNYPSQIDFMRGVATQAAGIENNTTPFNSGAVAVHMTEISLALSAGKNGYRPKTGFEFEG